MCETLVGEAPYLRGCGPSGCVDGGDRVRAGEEGVVRCKKWRAFTPIWAKLSGVGKREKRNRTHNTNSHHWRPSIAEMCLRLINIFENKSLFCRIRHWHSNWEVLLAAKRINTCWQRLWRNSQCQGLFYRCIFGFSRVFGVSCRVSPLAWGLFSTLKSDASDVFCSGRSRSFNVPTQTLREMTSSWSNWARQEVAF